MLSTQLSQETIDNLSKLIGAKIFSIYAEGGDIELSEHMTLDGYGMISIIFKKEKTFLKLRLKFQYDVENCLYSEFYEREKPPTIWERYNPKTGVMKYDLTPGEDSKIYTQKIVLRSKSEEDFQLFDQVKSIKIYHYEGKFEKGG